MNDHLLKYHLSFVLMLDLYPTLVNTAGGKIPSNIREKSLLPILKDKEYQVRDMAFSVTQDGKAFLVRPGRWAYIQYDQDEGSGTELYDMYQDPQQFGNLAKVPAHQGTVSGLQQILREKLAGVLSNDLGENYK